VGGKLVFAGRRHATLFRFFVDGGAAGHAGQDRGDIDLADAEGDRLLVVEIGTAVVGDADFEGVVSRSLGFAWRPGEDTRAGIDAGPRRSADETEGQRVAGQVVVAGGSRKGKRSEERRGGKEGRTGE